jgi:hypothetical protein
VRILEDDGADLFCEGGEAALAIQGDHLAPRKRLPFQLLAPHRPHHVNDVLARQGARTRDGTSRACQHPPVLGHPLVALNLDLLATCSNNGACHASSMLHCLIRGVYNRCGVAPSHLKSLVGPATRACACAHKIRIFAVHTCAASGWLQDQGKVEGVVLVVAEIIGRRPTVRDIQAYVTLLDAEREFGRGGVLRTDLGLSAGIFLLLGRHISVC